ncbi:Fur family transcriptional regulator [Marinigracilibium pacificum]|uniref:Transcriptional repressor n=1 Tax=Marinigracilibium pacificum TaxID=2729599 RepID=A0A848J372_9BACT|nr:transcriptional repressor [Marinigracilibium pacificum]NMM49955.1 transcriptional repressor [Marinigracilibium pacificum]
MIEEKLQYRNIRPTAMRILVLKQLLDSDSAMSLSDLEESLENADKATLYRTLKKFEENQLIHSIDDGSGSLKYAPCNENCNCETNDQHVHFHCESCQKTYCITNIGIPNLNLPKGFIPSSANMVFKGNCSSCS